MESLSLSLVICQSCIASPSVIKMSIPAAAASHRLRRRTQRDPGRHRRGVCENWLVGNPMLDVQYGTVELNALPNDSAAMKIKLFSPFRARQGK
jgi:hypothetical protein